MLSERNRESTNSGRLREGFLDIHNHQWLQGYNVRGTVRSLASKEKVSHLEALAAALPGSLKLYEADLLKEGSFDEVVQGSDYVFHMASPFLASHSDPYVRPLMLPERLCY